ncbi:Uncharacterised protein g11338 [Pycnogonum litorale]
MQVTEENSVINSFAASALSGIVVVCGMTPFDVASTRLYNQPTDVHDLSAPNARKKQDFMLKCLKQPQFLVTYVV